MAALLSTAACGGNNDDDKKKGGAAGYNAAVKKVANASDKKGGTLKYIGVQDADSWDTTRGYYGFAWNFMRYYSRQLVSYNPAPDVKGLELKPDLAAAAAEVTDDGKTYTYKLKDGVKWEDGKPITSQDIKYGIERQWAQDVLAGGPVYIKDLLDPEGKYKGPYKDKGGLDAIQTPDDKTIVFKLPKANSDFEQMLALPFASPVREDKDTKSKYALKPFSSGPYKFASYKPNNSIVLERNPEWDAKTDDIRKALPDKVTVDLITNADEMDKRLVKGDYDLFLNGTGMGQTGRATALKEYKGNLDNPTMGYIRYAAFSPVAPFDNIECRKAAIYGADHKSLQNARGGPLAGGDIGTNMLPPVVPGAEGQAYDPFGLAKNEGKPDTAKAEAALKACGKADGFKTTIAVRNNKPEEIATAESLQASLKKIGIEAEIDEYDGAQTSGIIGNPKVVKDKGYGIIIMGWGPDFPTVQGYGMPLWHSSFVLDSGNNNYAEIKNKKIDAAFAAFNAELDEAKKAEIAKDINHQVMETATYLPFTFEKIIAWRGDRTTNVYATAAYSGQYDFASIGVK